MKVITNFNLRGPSLLINKSRGGYVQLWKFTVSRPREPVFWASLTASSARLQPYAPVFLFYVGLCTDVVWWYAH